MRRSRVMVKCRSASSAKYGAVLLALAMAVTSTGPGLRTVRAQTAPVGAGFNLDAGDLRFIFRQIQI